MKTEINETAITNVWENKGDLTQIYKILNNIDNVYITHFFNLTICDKTSGCNDETFVEREILI